MNAKRRTVHKVFFHFDISSLSRRGEGEGRGFPSSISCGDKVHLQFIHRFSGL